MATLAIRGHDTRGKEVIEILKMFGAKNKCQLNGNNDGCAYYVNNGEIMTDYIIRLNNIICFTIEEFLEKYPYKVGDKVIIKSKNQEATVEKVDWCCDTITYWLKYDGFIEGNWRVERLQPYKEETMEEPIKTITIEDFKANSKEWLIDTLESMSKDDALQTICDLHDELHKPQFPTTYEECCKVLNIIPNNKLVFSNPNEESEYAYRNLALYNDFNILKVCRDAYWKIAGDWKPDVMYCDLYCIGYDGNLITWKMQGGCRLLVFPTAEMRDAFYNNFEKLIEECKKLL